MGTIALDTIVLDVSEGKRLVQQASATGSIALSGTQTGGTSIEARVVKYSDGGDLATPFSWVEIQADGTSPWSGTLSNIPEGPQSADDDWYAIEVRLGNETSTIASSKTVTEKFGVGDWIPFLGQSNTSNFWDRCATCIPDETSEATLPLDDRTCKIVRDTDIVEDLTTDDDGLITFADRLLLTRDVPIGFLCYAVGATAMDVGSYDADGTSSWLDLTPAQGPSGGTALYTAFTDALTYIGGTCACVFLFHGEADSNYHYPSSVIPADPPTTEDSYYTNLNTFVSWLRADCNATNDIPILLCTLTRKTGAKPMTGWPNLNKWQSIRDAQIRVTEEDSAIYRIDTAHYYLRSDAGTFTHLYVTARQDLGDKAAYVYLHHLDSGTYPYAPPEITDFKQVSAIQTTVTVPSGLTPSSSLEGWHVYDQEDTEIAVSSVAYSGTTVTINHSDVSGGDPEIDSFVRSVKYLYGSEAAGTTDATVIVLKESSGEEWPLWGSSSIRQEFIRKIADKHNTTREEHNHWNFRNILDLTNAVFTTTKEATFNAKAPLVNPLFTGLLSAEQIRVTTISDLVNFTAKMVVGQTANPIEVLDSTGTPVWTINTVGSFNSGSGTAACRFQIGSLGTGDRNARMNWVTNDGVAQPAFRVDAVAGANQQITLRTRGTGNFLLETFEAADMVFNTHNIMALTLDGSTQDATFTGNLSCASDKLIDIGTTRTNAIHAFSNATALITLSFPIVTVTSVATFNIAGAGKFQLAGTPVTAIANELNTTTEGNDRTVLVVGAQIVGADLTLAGTTNAPVPYDTKKYDPETILINGSYEITPGAGDYFIEASTSFEQTVFNARATAKTEIQANIDGAGFTTVEDSEGFGYSRIAGGTDKVTVTSFGYVTLDADDLIRVQAFIDEGGTDTIRTLAIGCTIRIQRL